MLPFVLKTGSMTKTTINVWQLEDVGSNKIGEYPKEGSHAVMLVAGAPWCSISLLMLQGCRHFYMCVFRCYVMQLLKARKTG